MLFFARLHEKTTEKSTRQGYMGRGLYPQSYCNLNFRGVILIKSDSTQLTAQELKLVNVYIFLTSDLLLSREE